MTPTQRGYVYLACIASQRGMLKHWLLMDDTPDERDKVFADIILDTEAPTERVFKGEDITIADMRKVMGRE